MHQRITGIGFHFDLKSGGWLHLQPFGERNGRIPQIFDPRFAERGTCWRDHVYSAFDNRPGGFRS